jgi:HEPN domain-containing protein
LTQPDARAEAQRWLTQAEDDFGFAEHGLRLGYYAQTCFLAQQVSEKAAKALHYARGARLVFGHSVDALLEALESVLPAVSSLREGAKELDQHYVPTRYPNGLPGNIPSRAYTEAQARRALEHARAIVGFVRSQLR